MISFIIPTLNEEKVIEKLLVCLSLYDGESEIIITDGCSKDRTLEISKRYTDLIVRHDGKSRQTIGEGRNMGAKIARGEYLVFLDADVYIPDVNSFFKKALSVFESKPELVAATVSIRVLKEFETKADRLVFACLGYFNYFLNNIIKSAGAAGEFQMIKRMAFEKVGGFDKTIVASEDYELFRRLSKVGLTYYISSLTIFHTGRRAHKTGWPKLLSIWILNGITVQLTKKSVSKEWEEIR